METIFGGVGVLSVLSYSILAILWIAVPVFVILISKRIKEMRDIAIESQAVLKELNANIKYLKRKYNEENQSY
ncbi:hypothetical protein L1077_26395 [Pseudoalteromonas luteoviolacea]|uniref:hypothetical protein n=1 Tax=Pseudoalteromonas luteoviolacea TaxID=43657 RepID=UPI001F44E5C6|nr:hypothetical protein [Pseudoalteromonas luteoviolacea]MCF6442958.1 hypothetical protein [Pseudoalteromonas luteoviolacea]